MERVVGAVEVVDAPTGPSGVQAFLPRLSRALAGGAPLATINPASAVRTQALEALGRADLRLPWNAALVVPTSGSTGDPRLAVLSRAALVTSADLSHEALGGPGRWLLTLPITHIAGLQVLVRSLRSGLQPAVLDVSLPFTVERFTAAVSALDVTASEYPHYTSLVPTQLQRLLDDGAGVEALWKLDAVLVGGAAVAPVLLDRARDAGVTVVRTYGMTETCGGCVYDGVALGGVDVTVTNDGRVRVRGPVMFEGYLGSESSPFDDGWFVTSDIGRMDGNVLTVEGRADNVVISGGVKVPAEAVERQLLALPDVVDAVVVGVPDAEWGERVVAVVTSTSEIDVEVARQQLRELIADEWLPRSIVRVDELPMLASGKPDRVAIRAIAADLAR